MFYDMIIIDYYPERDVGAVVVGLGQVYYELGYAWFFNDWLGDLKEMLSYFKSLHWWHFSLTHLMKFWNILQIFGQAFKSRLQTKPASSPSPNIDIAGRYICN